MNAYAITSEQIAAYGETLRLEERCEATVRKYVGAVMALFRFLPLGKTVMRELLLAWKAEIRSSGANVMILAVKRFCAFMSWGDLLSPNCCDLCGIVFWLNGEIARRIRAAVKSGVGIVRAVIFLIDGSLSAHKRDAVFKHIFGTAVERIEQA